MSACGSTSNAAASFNAGWAQQAARVLSQARAVTKVRPLATSTSAEMKSLGRSADDVFARAPNANLRTAQDAVLLKQITTVRDFQALVVVADAKRLVLLSDADEVAGRATADQRVKDYLKRNGTEILQDAACDAAFSLMTPGERSQADESGWEPYVENLAVEPSEGAIVNYSQRALAGFFGSNVVQLVRWGQYGKGIVEKAQKYNGGLGGMIEYPSEGASAQYMTRAYVHYARTCLRPPV